MRVAPRSVDVIVAELLPRIARVSDLAEGCSLALDRIVADAPFQRAVLLLMTEGGLRGSAWGVDDVSVKLLTNANTHAGAALVALAVHPGVHRLPADSLPGFYSVLAITFTGVHDAPAGVLLVDAAGEDERTQLAAEVINACGPVLHFCARLSDTENHLTRASRQQEMLNAIVDTLSDPVILTNTRNDIVLANQRAESVLVAREDSSEGRRRAIEVNNLLFSSFLTQTVIGGTHARTRELNLVDPTDGSDLLFEVIVLPIEISAAESGVVSILRDITDLKRALTELEVQFNRSRVAEHRSRQERDRLNVMLENVSDPILVTDDASNIILMNPEADRLFVLPPDADPESTYSRMVQANDTKFTSLISDFLLQTQRRRVERIDLVDPDTGKLLPAEVHSSKIVNSRGETTAMVSVLHDLTQFVENQRLATALRQLNEQLEDRIKRATLELEQRNRQLEWQSAELEKASRLKSEFLAAMSHELRTPLNVIIGYSSLMRERIYGELSDAQDETLQKVHATSQHLLALINDVLDLSKIEAGKMPLHVEEVDLADVIMELSETVMPMVRKKQLDYRTEFAPGTPHVHTDRTKLKQILLNLLSNAIKFTSRGTVIVGTSILSGGTRVRLVVEDSGIGIKPEYLDVIFEDFRQLDQSHTREYGGTGLGLSITKNLLALLGGTITVESTFGAGSRFTVELPIRMESVLEERPISSISMG